MKVRFKNLNAGTYYAWAEDLAGNRTNVEFKVNKATGSVTASISGTTTVGQTLTASYQTESDGKVTYQWWRGNASTAISGATSSTYKLVEADAGAYIGVTVKVAEGTNYIACEDTDTKTSVIIKDIKPLMTTHPSSVAVKEGNKATFTVVATGSNLKYQWQQSTNKGSTWSNVSGATSASYTTGTTTAGMNGYQYRCVISNNAESINSNAATLTVYYPPKVATHPTNQTVTYPAKATFTVAATEGNPSTTYQWQYRTSSSGTWANVTTAQGTGGTTTSFTTVATKVSMTGYQYRCVLSNEQYPSHVASNAATLTVNKAIINVPGSPPDITYDGNSHAHGITIPQNVSIVDGSTTSAINAGTHKVVLKLNDSENYKWNDDSITNKTIEWKINRKPINEPVVTDKIYNKTKHTGLASGTGYTRSGTYEATNVGKYEAIATLDSNHIWNDNTLTAKTYVWSILDNPIGTITGPTAVQKKEEETATFKVEETQGTNNQYQWYYNTTNSTTGGTKINNATSPEYSVVVDRSMNNRYYYCVISNNSESATSLTSKASGTALLTVWWPHEISAHPVDVKVKKDETATFNVVATGGNPSEYSYQWYSVPTATGGTPTKINGAINDTYSYKPTQNISGMWYYCEVSNGQYMLTSNRAKLVADVTVPKINSGTPSVTHANKEVTFTVPLIVTDTGEGFNIDSFIANDIIVKVNGTVISPTLKTLDYKSQNNDNYNYLLTLKGVTNDGILTLDVTAGNISDELGNTNADTSMLISGIIIDNIAPVISSNGEVTGTNQGYINKDDTITIPVKITDVGGIKDSEFTADDVTVLAGGIKDSNAKVQVAYGTNTGNDYTYIITVSGISGNGEVTLEIDAGKIADLATNTNIKTTIAGLNVIVDNIKPIVNDIVLSLGSYDNTAKLYPESLPSYNESWINEDVYTVIKSSDESSGVETYWHSVGSELNFERITTEPADREIWNVEMDERDKVYYRVIDKAGNISDSVSVIIKIDTTEPKPAGLDMRLNRENGTVYEYDAAYPTSKSIYIKPTGTEDDGTYQSGILKTEYIVTFNNGVTTTTSDVINGNEGTLLKETGTYTIEVITTDRAGNTSSKFFNAAIDKRTENTIKINNIHDEGSGVTKVTITAKKQGASVDAIEPIVIENPEANITQRIKLSDGTFIITVKIEDGVGLVKELQQTITNEL